MAKRLIDRKHLRYIASLPCCLCPEDGTGWHDATVIPHHLLEGEGVVRGRGLKPGDDKTIPLCFPHHAHIHALGGDKEYLAQFGIDGVELADKLYNR